MKGIKSNSQPVRNKKKKRENTRQRKKNNHAHKTVFTWFDNLPISTELQGYHYYQGRIQSTTVSYNLFSLLLSMATIPH